MKSASEKQITRAIRNFLKGMGVFHWKAMQGLGATPGVPDILGVIPGHIHKDKAGALLGIEVKTERGRLSEHQRKFIERINRDGGIAFVARSVDDVINNLKINDRFLF